MGIVPDTRLGKIQFYESHLDAWASNAVSIGLTTVQVTTLGELTGEARKAYDDAELARLASKTATQAFYDAVRAMHNGSGAGADMIDAIRLKAQNTNDPNVYTLAQIPPPAPPGTTPPPGIPFAFTVGVLQDGSVELKWKCVNPSGTQGTIYEIKRRIGESGAFQFVGAIGTRSFIDDTLPSGSSPVTYQVTGVRSTTRGNPGQFTVSFGIGGGGGFAITGVKAVSPARLAA